MQDPTQTGHPTAGIGRREAVARARLLVTTTGAASRCINSSGDITRCVVPSHHSALSLSFNCLAALNYNRSSVRAGQVIQRHSWSSRLRPCASTRKAARSHFENMRVDHRRAYN